MRPAQILITQLALVNILMGCGLAASPLLEASTPAPSSTAVTGAMATTDEPTATPAFAAIAELSSEPTPSPTASPTLIPAPRLSQLTSGGCCVQPFWSPDGQRVLYIDRPGQEAPAGLWGVDLQGNPPEFVTDRVGIYSPDIQKRAFLKNGETVVEQLSTGEQWVIPSGGRAVSFSPDGMWLAWTAGQSGPPFDRAQREVWASRFDGSQARQVFSAFSGGVVGWFPDGRLLVNGRSEALEGGQAFWELNLDADSQPRTVHLVELDPGTRLRGAEISPDGNWLVYMVTFSSDANMNGLWLVDVRSGESRRLDLFGAYQWRDGGHLLVIPLDLSQTFQRLFQVQADTGQVEALSDPAVTPFKIANGDWHISPDGQRVAFVSAEDQNIWLLTLPERP